MSGRLRFVITVAAGCQVYVRGDHPGERDHGGSDDVPKGKLGSAILKATEGS
jgi:hypothetical protein